MIHIGSIDTNNAIITSIYDRAVNKFFAKAADSVVFIEVAEYIKKQLNWKKQCEYTYSLPLLKEVCDRIAEDFQNGCEHYAPNATNYRDLYYSIIYDL